MKTKLIAITGAFFLSLCSLQLSAQEQFEQEAYKDGAFKRFGVALKASTYGYGLDFSTSLTSNLKTRIGFNYLGFGYDNEYTFNADAADGGSDVPGSLENFKFKFPNANILFDFYPVKSGIFCITAGAYIGSNELTADGKADRAFLWDDITVNPQGGKFDATVKMGSTFKPYVGLGLGRTISKSRVSFRFDLGVVFQGDYTIESSRANGSASGVNVLQKELDDFPDSLADALKLWPMMSFSISYRIK